MNNVEVNKTPSLDDYDYPYAWTLKSEIMTEDVAYVLGLVNATMINYQLSGNDIPQEILALKETMRKINAFQIYDKSTEQELFKNREIIDDVKTKIKPFYDYSLTLRKN